MPRLIEMGALLLRCKQRADKVFDDHVGGDDTAEWRRLISEVWAADVFQPVAGTGSRYFETRSTLTTTGAAYVSEPSGIMNPIRLDYVDASGQHHELQQVSIQEEGSFSGAPAGDRAYRFAHVDDRIYLYPTPPSGQTYELLYVPQATDLSGYADDACVDVVNADGEACVIWGVAALARVKASQDVALHMAKQQLHRDRLEYWAASLALTQPARRHHADEYDERVPFEEGDWRFR